ncbi:hypothetical protein B0I35DRAFT_492560 [Stachybotrys elegans]|uniref:Uncharacterized protein n=1 Tax=Stachybotrys elegans TaxID=80388 RepID=A0A8K0SGT3_9HYPO|nr:hypothetical protein B0I35DRAFT_492560 [Stachybotrys elegans]
MSGLSLEYAIGSLPSDVDEHMRERIRRQMDAFSMGVSRGFPSDLGKEINPQWLHERWSADVESDRNNIGGIKEVGVGRVACDLDPQAIGYIFKNFGYGKVWPENPSTGRQLKYAWEGERCAILDDDENLKRDYNKWAEYVLGSHQELHGRMSAYYKEIQAQIILETDDQSQERDPNCNQGLPGILRDAWTKTIRKLRSKLDLKANHYDMDEKCMPATHSPDLESSRRTSRKKDQARVDEHQAWLKNVRACFLVPHLNIEDLSQPNNLLNLLYYRGDAQKGPADFTKLDYDSCHIGRATRILRGCFYGGISVVLGHSPHAEPPGSYIHFDVSFPNRAFVAATDPTLQNGQSAYVGEAARAGLLFSPGEAQTILFGQAVTYTFLNEAPSADRVKRHIEEYRHRLTASALLLNKSPFQYHPRNDEEFLLSYKRVLQDAAASAEGSLRAIFSSENLFLDRVEEEADHHYCKMRYKYTKDTVHPQGREMLKYARWDLYYDYLGSVCRRTFLDYIIWNDLVEQMEALETHIHLDARDGSDEAQQIVVGSLTATTRELFLFYLAEINNRGKFAASPKIRHIFSCITNRQSLVDEDNCVRKSVINFPMLEVAPLASGSAVSDLSPEEADVFNAISMRKLLEALRVAMRDQEAPVLSNLLQDTLRFMDVLVNLATDLDSMPGSQGISNALDFAGLTDCPPTSAWKARENYLWEASITPGGVSPKSTVPSSVVIHELDSFVFQTWDVLRRHYRRIYGWLDRSLEPGGKRRDTFTGGRPVEDKGFDPQLPQFGLALVNALDAWTVDWRPSSSTSEIPVYTKRLISDHTVQKLRETILGRPVFKADVKPFPFRKLGTGIGPGTRIRSDERKRKREAREQGEGQDDREEYEHELGEEDAWGTDRDWNKDKQVQAEEDGPRRPLEKRRLARKWWLVLENVFGGSGVRWDDFFGLLSRLGYHAAESTSNSTCRIRWTPSCPWRLDAEGLTAKADCVNWESNPGLPDLAHGNGEFYH